MIVSVILAAGQSRRMGGENKLLRPFRGKPLVIHAVEAALGADLGPVMAVLGHQADEVAALLPGSVTPVINGNYAMGMGKSLAVGIAALPTQATGALVLLGDMPMVDAALIAKVAAHFDGTAVHLPMNGERRGHPVLFPARLFPALRCLTGDEGGRSVLATEEIRAVPAGPECLRDFDIPQDWDV